MSYSCENRVKKLFFNTFCLLKNSRAGKALSFLLLTVLAITASDSALASDLSNVADNIAASSQAMPGLIAISAYMTGIILGVIGVVKIKDSVVNPQQTPLKEGVGRLLAGGALFALPIVYEAMYNTINGGGVSTFMAIIENDFNAAFGFVTLNDRGGDNINDILSNIATSTQAIPGLVMIASYVLGLLSGYAGILKMREHIDNPQQVAIREPVTRFLVGGALFALPMVLEAIVTSIGDGAGFTIANIFGAGIMGAEWSASGYGASTTVTGCGGGIAAAATVDVVICNLVNGTEAFPSFLVMAAYVFGIFLAVWGILKLRDHVLAPQQTPIWDGVMRLLAAGGFFALPYIVQTAHQTLTAGLGAFQDSGTAGTVSAGGLDAVMVDFVESIFAPMTVLLNMFGLVAGMILVMIAISRLMKSVQEGPRGPGGIGTIMTFIAGGALISFMPMVTSFSGSLFGAGNVETIPALQYTTGMDPDVINHSHAVISAIIRFMIVLGLISFARGVFIVRGVAEGNSQASLMAGITHLVGGALAVNLGPLVNAVQTTLGLETYGIVFS